MDIQTTLTLTIQAVVISFVALMVFDFIDGLWVVPLPPIGWEPSVIEQPTVSATVSQPTPRAIALLESTKKIIVNPSPRSNNCRLPRR
nr:hypothetical protein [Nostoc sp. ChiSLP03a]